MSAPKRSSSGFKHVYFLAYTPREDSNSRGYENWLREVDNPFFNSIPAIVHYTNWKITSPTDCAFPFAYFDLMYVEDKNDVEGVWGNPDVTAFAQGWVEKWARYPNASEDEGRLNFHVYLCERVSEEAYAPMGPVALHVSNGAIPKSKNRQTFRVVSPVIGDARFSSFALDALNNSGEFLPSCTARPAGCYGSALAEIVARPE